MGDCLPETFEKMSLGREALGNYIIPRFSTFVGKGKIILNIGKHSFVSYSKFFPDCEFLELDKVANLNPDITADIEEGIESVPNNHFDAVIMIGVYEYLFKPERAFREIGRILKEGGYFLAALPGVGYCDVGLDLHNWVDCFSLFRIEESYFFYENKKDVSSICVIVRK